MRPRSRRSLPKVLAAAVLALVTALVTALVGGGGAATAQTAYPNSMDALGDSMTRAFNTCALAWTDCLANSWATGTNSQVNSYYERLLALNSGIRGYNYNDAVSGAKMSDLNRQASSAVSRQAQLVTVLMGNNDACGGSSGVMTDVSTFQSEFQQAMATLTSGLPNASVRVASVPDAYQLWTLFHTNSSAVAAWNTYQECNALLANPTSTAQADVDRRAAFRQREIDYNTVLANVCAQYSQCRFDGDAGFNARFTTADVSTVDYFHPSVAGQALLASVAWGALGY
jgi:lysophospholipase L1-like esterase